MGLNRVMPIAYFDRLGVPRFSLREDCMDRFAHKGCPKGSGARCKSPRLRAAAPKSTSIQPSCPPSLLVELGGTFSVALAWETAIFSERLRISRHRGHPFHGIADSVSRQGGHRFTLIADSVSA